MNKRLAIIFVILALALSALACDLPFDLPFDLPKLPFLGGSGLPEGVTLGETYRSEGGGFSISKVNGYTLATETQGVRMVAPNASTATGPAVYAYGEILTTAQTNQQALEKMISTASKDAKFTDMKEITISGVKGLQAAIAGVSGGVATKGRLAVAMFSPTQSFVLMVGAPDKQWDEGVNALYDALLESVTLFAAKPAATQAPTAALKTATKPAATQALSTLPPQATPTLVKSSPVATQAGKPQVIRQWAKSAVASSEYDNPDWAASQATGAPDTFECGDFETAWASDGSEAVEWIELTYATPVYPTEVVIYQSYNPSAVTEVMLITTTGEKYTALTTEPEVVETCPDKYTITLNLTKAILVNKVRVTIDQSLFQDWTEIDAVELAGTSTFVASTGATPTAVPTLVGQKTATKSSTPDVGFFCTMNKDGKDSWYSSIETAYASTATEYVLGFNTTDQTQKVTLYLPRNLTQKIYQLVDFNPAAANKAPSALVFFTPSNYYAKASSIMIISEIANNAISGVVTIAAGKEGDPTKLVNVVCSFSKVPLK